MPKQKQRKIGAIGKTKAASSVVKMDPNSRPWSDLPQDIVDLIVTKLHFTDQVRALAVCKSWGACKDYVKSSESLPWLVSRRGGTKSVTCDLVDPYSQKVFTKVYKGATTGHSLSIHELAVASRHGWVLYVHCNVSYDGSYFLQSHFTHQIIQIPLEYPNIGVTMKVSRKRSECEIFAVTRKVSGSITVDTYRVSKDDECVGDFKSYTFDDKVAPWDCYNIVYMNGNICALYKDDEEGNMLICYSLEDESWKVLTKGYPESYESLANLMRCWLLEVNGNLMMVRCDMKDESYKWIIFRFDWSAMSWVFETGLKGYAIFISDFVAFAQPLIDRDGKKSEECKLFYDAQDLSAFDSGFRCCSLNGAGGTQIHSHEYEWISRFGRRTYYFVEPPYFGI